MDLTTRRRGYHNPSEFVREKTLREIPPTQLEVRGYRERRANKPLKGSTNRFGNYATGSLADSIKSGNKIGRENIPRGININPTAPSFNIPGGKRRRNKFDLW
jgi:hypothetical protein